MEDARGQIIAVTGDPYLRALLEEAFRAHEPALPVVFAGGAAEALDGASRGPAALLIGAGGEICAALLQGGAACPVIALVEKHEERPALPARDVFLRPFRLGLLLARIAAYRDGGGSMAPSANLLQFGPFSVNRATGALTRGGEGAGQLTEKERDILVALYARRGETLGRRELLEQVWGYGEGIETHTLETHIYRLRQKIEDDPASPVYLITEETGYRLNV